MDEVGEMVDLLQTAGLVVVGLVVYTLVALAVLAWLGHRYQQVKVALALADASRARTDARRDPAAAVA